MTKVIVAFHSFAKAPKNVDFKRMFLVIHIRRPKFLNWSIFFRPKSEILSDLFVSLANIAFESTFKD